MLRIKKILFVMLLLAPLAWLVWQLTQGQLGAQPAEEMNHELGEWTYRLLVANLAWGSLLALGWWPRSWRNLTLLRRHLGVVTFVYASMHMSFYVIKEGDVALALEQLFTKTYLILGFCAWLILLLLALTSNNWSVRYLRTRWKSLHRLAYVAIALGTVHFMFIEKKDWTTVLPLLIPLLITYGLRIFAAAKASSRWRKSPSS